MSSDLYQATESDVRALQLIKTLNFYEMKEGGVCIGIIHENDSYPIERIYLSGSDDLNTAIYKLMRAVLGTDPKRLDI